MPGLLLDTTGFSSSAAGADKFSFALPFVKWDPVSTTDVSQTANIQSHGQSPVKGRADLTSTGFSLFFANGFRLSLKSAVAPFLSWKGGSVGPDLPTAPSNWVLVSFQSSQPPILLVFENRPVSAILNGKPGNWILRSSDLVGVWVRVVAPTGIEPVATASASQLGDLVTRVSAEESLWTQPAPLLQKLDVSSDATNVTATWHFDRPGARVPFAALLAPLGGYEVRVTSPVHAIDADTLDGPLSVCTGKDLTIHFPAPVLPGSIFSGAGPDTPASTDPKSVSAVANLAFASLFAGQAPKTVQTAQDVLAQYLTSITYSIEPHTGDSLPYDGPGVGLDLAAAHSLLMQATLFQSPTDKTSPNALLTSVQWRRDWLSWLPAASDGDVARRSAALASVACLLRGDSQSRLDAAILEAGLEAERGRQMWLVKRGLAKQATSVLEPMDALRLALFGMIPNTGKPALFKYAESKR